MGIDTMGKILVAARIENLEDLYKVRDGAISEQQVRRIEVDDAQVDLDSMFLSMPKRMIQELGLQPVRSWFARNSKGAVTEQVYESVRLTIQGHDGLQPVVELPDECPVRIGCLTLEHLDLVLDPVSQKVIGNPAHGGEQMIDLYYYEALASGSFPPSATTGFPYEHLG